MGFSRQEYWSGLPFPLPGDLPDPGIEPWSPALQADSLPTEPRGKPLVTFRIYYSNIIIRGDNIRGDNIIYYNIRGDNRKECSSKEKENMYSHSIVCGSGVIGEIHLQRKDGG